VGLRIFERCQRAWLDALGKKATTGGSTTGRGKELSNRRHAPRADGLTPQIALGHGGEWPVKQHWAAGGER
jgi:hypothetical protein